jgi:hypothetical protein
MSLAGSPLKTDTITVAQNTAALSFTKSPPSVMQSVPITLNAHVTG